jgi:hypothetical protein
MTNRHPSPLNRRHLRRQISAVFLASTAISIVMYRGTGIVYVPAIATAIASALLLAAVVTLATRRQS